MPHDLGKFEFLPLGEGRESRSYLLWVQLGQLFHHPEIDLLLETLIS